jgi:uncharacterized membrane protein (DUF485 family)
MDLVGRVKGILLDPKAEWPKIEAEPGDFGWLFTNYVMYVSAIPPVCAFIGTSLIGIHGFHVGIVAGVMHAVLSYVLTIVGVFIAAYVIDYLAGTFSARRDFNNAMRVACYTPTAAWVVGIFNLIPFLGILGILGLYSLYLLHTGLGALMRPPADKAMIYTVVTVVCCIVIGIVVAIIPAMLLGGLLVM